MDISLCVGCEVEARPGQVTWLQFSLGIQAFEQSSNEANKQASKQINKQSIKQTSNGSNKETVRVTWLQFSLGTCLGTDWHCCRGT